MLALDKNQVTLLKLIRISLGHEQKCSIPNDINWNRVLNFSRAHGVIGIVIDALELLPAEQRPERDVLMKWHGQVMFMEQMYEQHMKAIADLAKFYKRQGIRMMVLKGYGLSLNWPRPKNRPVGDLDVYLTNDNDNLPAWNRADELVRSELGISVEDGHEHHTVFVFKGVMVENHYDFINTKAHRDAHAIEVKLKELASKVFAQDAQNMQIDSISSVDSACPNIYYPNADFNAIFLIRHLGQHFAGDRVTLRQILDWATFLEKKSNEVHWDEVVPFLKEMEIWTFFNQINAICVDYLGFREDCFTPIERKDDLEIRILEDILNPEFTEEKPAGGLLKVLVFKFRRWWNNRWKHPLVYKEWLLPMFLTLLWSHLRRFETIKD